jgi:hypothetical protein
MLAVTLLNVLKELLTHELQPLSLSAITGHKVRIRPIYIVIVSNIYRQLWW